MNRAAPVFFLVLGLWLTPMTILGPGFERMPGEPCDTGFSSFVLEHGFRWLAGLEPSYFSAPFLYPFKNSITLSDNFLATLPLYSGFRGVGLDREGAYQAWFLSLFILNFLCAYWAFRLLNHTPALASLGAYLFAFLAPVLEEVTHPALLHLFPIPLGVCGLILWAETGSVKAFAGMCTAVVLEFYGTCYLGTFLTVALGLFALSWLVIQRKIGGEWSEKGVLKLLACLTGVILALLPLALPYMATAADNGFQRFWNEVFSQLPTISDLFRASPGNLLWGWTSNPGGILSFNNAMHVGILPWLGIGAYLILLLKKRGERRLSAALLVPILLTVLTLRIGEFSLFKYLQWLPVFQSMRALTRVGLVGFFFLLLVFLGVARALLEAIHQPLVRNAFFAVLCLLAILDQYNTLLDHYGYEKRDRARDVASVREDILRSAPNATAVAYLPEPGAAEFNCRVTVTAMLASQELGLPIVNAYTSWFPKGYEFFMSSTCAALRRWLLRTQAASDKPLFAGLNLVGPGAGPGVKPVLSGPETDTGELPALDGSRTGSNCLPVPAGQEAARAELLRRFETKGSKEDLVWALGMKGFTVLGSDELWMSRRAELTLRQGESLTLEGVSFSPLEVRVFVDGKDAGKLSFWGLPNKMTLNPGRTACYTFVADRSFVNPEGGILPKFPAVSIIFTKVSFNKTGG